MITKKKLDFSSSNSITQYFFVIYIELDMQVINSMTKSCKQDQVHQHLFKSTFIFLLIFFSLAYLFYIGSKLYQ